MFALGQERLRAGKPMWERKISVADVFHNDAMTFPEIRDAVVRKLRDSAWFKSKDEYDDLPQLVEELAEVEDTSDFDNVWDAIYDEADADRVWITTR
jgi:hypothetical protein